MPKLSDAINQYSQQRNAALAQQSAFDQSNQLYGLACGTSSSTTSGMISVPANSSVTWTNTSPWTQHQPIYSQFDMDSLNEKIIELLKRIVDLEAKLTVRDHCESELKRQIQEFKLVV